MSHSPLATPLTPGFMVIHGNRPELLRQLLVHWFSAHPLAPLEDEIILVQSNGIAQWLKLALAADPSSAGDGGCGIAAALDMQLPSRFVWQAYRAVLGAAAVPDTSPFDKPLLLWRLMRLLPELPGTPGYEPLARFLQDDGDLRKRHQLAEKIADLFDQYQVYRADWLADWTQGQDTLRDGRGQVRPLDPAQRWQAQLWRALLDDVAGQSDSDSSRATVHERCLHACRQLDERPVGLPRRVAVFGISSLPRQSLEVLLAISRFSQILLCVNNPCEHYWADLMTARDQARRDSRRHSRKPGLPARLDDSELHLHAHPLLAAWGKQGRDYIALLDEIDDPERYRAAFSRIGERIDLFASPGEDTLLQQLQDDIRLLRSTAESREKWPPVDPQHDRSLQFHIAHSPQREIEILHDQLLDAFDADPTLRPRDVIVMVPDVNAYAPHIQAVFGQIDSHDDRYLPFSIADLAQRQQQPLARALEWLLHLPESRLSVTDVLDLLDVAAVRQRFAIAPADLPLLQRWIRQSGIRWGLDAGHRRQFIDSDLPHNTWQHGLRRMLLGYAVGDNSDPLHASDWQGIEPYGEIAGLDAALLGPLASLLDQLANYNRTLTTPATPADWASRLNHLLADFFAPASDDDNLLLLQMQDSLQQWTSACASARLNDELPLAVVREHWLAQLEPGTLGQRFLAGRLTFATLMPMRAIPFRIVCLLGMNDGDYPRARPPLDFDLMANDSRPGDRSRRDDDRYLFLEALLSARERLHISWVGRSIHDNAERPPSVLVSQLRDHLDAAWPAGQDKIALSKALTVEHRLQPFNPAYFSAATPADRQPARYFTYAREWQGQSAAGMTSNAHPLPPARLDAPLKRQHLAAFLKDPVRTFYRERLHIDLNKDSSAADDLEPFAIDALDQWAMQDQLINARLAAIVRQQPEQPAVAGTLARLQRSGALPCGALAGLLAQALAEPLDEMFNDYRKAIAAWPDELPDQTLHHQHRAGAQTLILADQLSGLRASGGQRCRLELNSRNLIDGKHYRQHALLAAWVDHLAAHLAGQPCQSLIIGKNGQVTLRALDPAQARQYLDELLAAYHAALSEPLPLAAQTAFAWLARGGQPETAQSSSQSAAWAAACQQYEGGFKQSGEVQHSPYLQRVYPRFADLWSGGRFSELSARLLAPLRDCLGADPQSERNEPDQAS